MINDWKEYLKAKGFEKIGRRDFLRSSIPVAALICETPPRVGQREVRINVAIEVYDPWISDCTYHAMDLWGDLAPEGIYLHYDSTPRWLHPDESGLVYEVLKSCLMDWVNYWSNPDHLIRYFKNPVDTVLMRFSKAEQQCEHIFGLPVEKKRASPQVDYLLSLLYYHTHKFEEALAAANRYYQFIGSKTSYEGEPERTRRQIEQLSKANVRNK